LESSYYLFLSFSLHTVESRSENLKKPIIHKFLFFRNKKNNTRDFCFFLAFIKNNAQDLYSVVVAAKLFNFLSFSGELMMSETLCRHVILNVIITLIPPNLIFFFGLLHGMQTSEWKFTVNLFLQAEAIWDYSL
jgi:hypothetical protein